jgi:hypothetical protein
MPHNKGINKGKKGRSNKSRHNKQPVDNNGQKPSLLKGMQKKLPTFHNKTKDTPNDSTADSIGGGYYTMYKEATWKFHKWMSEKACLSFKLVSVNDYRRAMQQVLDHNMSIFLKNGEKDSEEHIVAPPDIMASLASSIRLREKVTANRFGSKDGGDLGHRYIIDVLKFCHNALRFGNRVATIISTKDSEETVVEDEIGGRFHILSVDDDDSEKDTDWEKIDRDIEERNLPKYTGVELEEEIDIKEVLLKGDDRFQANALLYTMDDYMGAIHNHFTLLKYYLRGNHELHETSSCMQLLLECTVAANAAIQSVNQAENEMMIDHPHLSSFYHVLALVKMPDVLAGIIKLIEKPRLEKNPHMALHFLAEIVECSFHHGGKERIPSIVNRLSKSQVWTRSIPRNWHGVSVFALPSR